MIILHDYQIGVSIIFLYFDNERYFGIFIKNTWQCFRINLIFSGYTFIPWMILISNGSSLSTDYFIFTLTSNETPSFEYYWKILKLALKIILRIISFQRTPGDFYFLRIIEGKCKTISVQFFLKYTTVSFTSKVRTRFLIKQNGKSRLTFFHFKHQNLRNQVA